jgi:predicted acyl esterase
MRRLLPVLLLLLTILPAGAAQAAPVPEGYTYEHAWFNAHDGIQLHAGVFLPEKFKGQKIPAIVNMTPYAAPNGGATGATGGSVNQSGPGNRFPELFEEGKIGERGYAYLEIDVRGFGGSGGCFEYYGPNEALDVKTAVEWVATQAWSDGKVAMWGKSYEAAQEVLALATKPKNLAAAVIQAPGLSGYTGLWMNRNHYTLGRYATSGTYTADDLAPPQNSSSITDPNYAIGYFEGLTSSPTCRSDALVGMNSERDRDGAFWKPREPYYGAQGSTVPVLWTHGFQDANTKPVHLDIWNTLKGPHSAWFGQFTHLRGHETGRSGFIDEAMRFLDRHVRGVKAPESDPTLTIEEGSHAGSRWRAEDAWPPTDAADWEMPIRPGSYSDAPGNTGEGTSAGQGHWTLTQPLPHAVHLAGEPVISVDLTTSAPEVNLIAHLYDVSPEGKARLVNRGGATLKAAGAQKAGYALYPSDWRFAPGHRIAIHLSGADDDWFTPGATNTSVQVAGGTLRLPVLRYVRDAYLEGTESDGMLDDSIFDVPADALGEGAVGAAPPPAQTTRPAPAPPAGSPASPSGRPKAAGKLKLRLTGKKLVVSGRLAGARRVKLQLRFGSAKLAQRTVKVARGKFRAVFAVGRLKAGRLQVTAKARGTTLRASVVKRSRGSSR